jgi:hypothetical protein
MLLSEVDRAFFEVLRLGVVAAGYLPDVKLQSTPNDYKVAKETLEGTVPGGKLIEVFGVGSSFSRAEKVSHKITIDRKEVSPGTVSGASVMKHISYEENGEQKFKKVFYPPRMSTLVYDIRIITDSIAYERVLMGIVDRYLPSIYTLKGVNSIGDFTQDDVPIWRGSVQNVSMLDNSNIEWVYRYEVRDIWIEQEFEVTTGIVPLTTIDFVFKVGENPTTDINFSVEPE